MKKLIGALAFLLLAAAALPAVDPTQVFTRPSVPAREALDRLNLKLAWYVYLPTAGVRDGIQSVVVLEKQVLVLTRGSVLVAYDADTGAVQWRARAGVPFEVTHPLGLDGDAVYVINRARQFGFQRLNGEPLRDRAIARLALAQYVGYGEGLAGWHGSTAYVAAANGEVFAEVFETGQVLWRFGTGGRVTHHPSVTDKDVFVPTEDTGLYRLDRQNGDLVWRNRQARRFLAANPKLVYATDRYGRLLVLDYVRGTELSVYDTRDFVVPIGNEVTDRLYLAAHNGLLLCLHDRAYAAPLKNKTAEVVPADPRKKEKPPEEKPEEMKPKLPEKKGEMPEKPKDKGDLKKPDKDGEKVPDKPR